MNEKRSDRILNVLIVVLLVVLLLVICVFLRMRSSNEQVEEPAGAEDSTGWDPESNELYVTENHTEFSDVYDGIGINDELVQLNEDIVLEDLKDGQWFVNVDSAVYTVYFGDETFTVSGDGTTTSGEYSIEYRSDAPQYMYLTMTSLYVNIEGFVGYTGEYVYIYSNVEDEGQEPPVHDYYLLRREIDG